MDETEAARLVVVYERVSTDKQDIARQAVQRNRARKGYPDAEVRVIQDDGVSAFKVPIFDRPGGAELCALVEAGRVAAIYTDAQDRLSRGEDDEWVLFRALCDANDAWIVVDGERITRDLGGRAMSYLRALLARQESEEKSRRIRGGKAVNARKGRPNGGPRRFGFERGEGKTGRLVPIAAEVAVVRRMMEEYVHGRTQREIARRLNVDGHRTARGKLWNQSQVSHLMRDPVWVGKIRNAEGEFDAPHGALVPLPLWDAVQATLRGPEGPRKGRRSERFLLGSGLLRCSCGATMRIKSEPKGYGWLDLYVCHGRYGGTSPGCRQRAVRRERIDGAVLAYFEGVGLDVDRMIEERRRARESRLADLTAREENARRTLDAAVRKVERLDAALAEGLETEDYNRAVQAPKSERTAAEGALRDLALERAAVKAEPDLADAEEETLNRLAELRAAVAGGVAENAEDVRAAAAALRRIFAHFVLVPWSWEEPPEVPGAVLRDDVSFKIGEYELVPVPRPDAVVLTENGAVLTRQTLGETSGKTPGKPRGVERDSQP